MNEEELRDIFAMFAMTKMAWDRGYDRENAEDCYRIADAMLEARRNSQKEPEIGIVALKTKRKTK